MNLSRRTLLKAAALTAGTAAAAAGAAPFALKEQAVFDPNDSYWAEKTPRPSPPLAKDIEVDIAVIGAGYTGLSAAWHLAKSDPELEIAVLEARHAGHGGSGRHGGMILPQTGPETMEIAHDGHTHKLTYDLTVDSMKALKRLVASTGIDCELKLEGYCHAVFHEDELPSIEKYVKQARSLGIPLVFQDKTKTREVLGTDRYAGSVFDPNGGQVHAMKLVRALKAAATDAGVEIFENSQVREIQEGNTIRLTVGEAGRAVRAKALVIAANAYVSKLGYFRNRIVPLHVQCAVTPPLDKSRLKNTGWKSRLPFYDSRNIPYHLILTNDNRIVIGGGNADYFFNNGTHYSGHINNVADKMLKELHIMYPALRDITFEKTWNGIIDISFDETEAVGVTGEHRNIFYGLGYNGHGINTAFMFGDIISHMYHKEEHGWEDTADPDHWPGYIPPEPFRWIGIQAVLQYFLWQDSK